MRKSGKGNITKKVPKGQDFIVSETRNLIIFRSKRDIHTEPKSSPTAPLRRLQKKTRKK